ncbi:methyltransferase domain-containing protein [Pseudomonas sp. PICF141]|uniref:methyltransferase domain-containing protein n=1 Tax=Pseudomonas sp. PICF141 TaxID=1949067 RepID=UPI000BABC635|nr:methyltransferase domain-containing protein [Pseudomonas sp. PICF141]PAU53562.1 hypothetical protein BZL43_22285 [Pseudomonas sp. PICF141]
MRYLVNGTLIRSENAAKPHTQKSKPVEDYLLCRGKAHSILDFGCGKLRYSDTLTKIATSVTFVDSQIQLSRKQIIRDEQTSVTEFVSKNYPHCKTVPFEKLQEHQEQYNLITCTNVLSAIPCSETLSNVILNIKKLLSRDGVAVFINQHRSSYFKKFESGKKHLNGYIYKNQKSTTYYGIFNKTNTQELLLDNGFEIIKSWCVGESTFVEARSPQSDI